MTNLDSLPDDIVLKKSYDIAVSNPEDFLRLLETSDRLYRILQDQNFIRKISLSSFNQKFDTIDEYRRLAAQKMVTRDSPLFIDVNLALERASKKNDQILITQFINQGANDWNSGLRGAAEGGHMELIKYFEGGGANDWNAGLIGAAKGNHKKLVEYFISKGANHIQKAMEGAALFGNNEIINYLDPYLDKVGKNNEDLVKDNYDEILFNAAQGGYFETVKLIIGIIELLLNDDFSYNPNLSGANGAISGEKPEILKFFLERDEDQVGFDALEYALDIGKVNMAMLVLEYTPDIDADTLINAILSGYKPNKYHDKEIKELLMKGLTRDEVEPSLYDSLIEHLKEWNFSDSLSYVKSMKNKY